MLFEKDTYYKYIKTLENMNTLIYVVIVGLGIIIGLSTGILTLIISVPISILLANMWTFATKMKIQKLKWEMDVYDKIVRKKEIV